MALPAFQIIVESGPADTHTPLCQKMALDRGVRFGLSHVGPDEVRLTSLNIKTSSPTWPSIFLSFSASSQNILGPCMAINGN